MKKILAAVCFTALFSTLAAGDFWPASRIADKPDDITELKVSSSIYSNRLYPVNPEEKYILSGEFRAAPETVATDFWFGLIPCDASRKQFGPRNIWVVKGTETVLAAPCKKEDKSILIKKADGWKTGKIYLAAFGKNRPVSRFPRSASLRSSRKTEPSGSASGIRSDRIVRREPKSGCIRMRNPQSGAAPTAK